MCDLRVARAYINRKTREREKKRKEGARDGGIGRRGREKEKEWRGKEKRSKKRGKEGGVVEKEGTKGRGERRDRKERRKDTQEETQGYTDVHRCTQMHTDRKKNIQTRYRQVRT